MGGLPITPERSVKGQLLPNHDPAMTGRNAPEAAIHPSERLSAYRFPPFHWIRKTSVIWSQRREEWKAQAEDARNEADIDYSRVVHSASFRRLQGKTQILNLGDSDFYRTRLTHSLEVAQIAEAIGRQYRKDFKTHPAFDHLPDISTIRAIALTHDVGHPPFGHGGEAALNYCMRNDGGFEGNGQTLRILSKLEKFSEKFGANMTRRTLLGVLKYPVPFSVVYNPALTPQLDPSSTAISIIDRKSSKPPQVLYGQ